jgi:hypothetical protein
MSNDSINNDFQISQQRKFSDDSNDYIKEANEVWRELGRQLILVGSVLISISAFAVNANDLSKNLNICDKYLLIFSWILIGLSMIFGIIQFITDYCYFRKWADVKYKIAEDIHKDPSITTRRPNGTTKLDELTYERQKDIGAESSTIYTWIQLSFIILGVILLVVIMGRVLFYTNIQV